MKKISLYLMILATLAFNSCSDWLSLTPEDSQTTDGYWRTKEEVEAVLGGGYSNLRDCLGNMIAWGEARGNSLTTGLYASTDLDHLNRWDILPSNSYCDWSAFYKVINQANMVIKYAPSVVDKDPSFNLGLMKSYVAEAYYLRALSYFYLVRNFRDVPLVLEPYLTDDQNYSIPKSADSVVFKQIKNDLDTALISTQEFFTNAWENKGRATKWAVYATLADVYLWTGEYNKCIDACEAVMNSGRVGLISGLIGTTNNWYTIFNPGNSNESIFELQYSYSKSQSNSLVAWFYTSSTYIYTITPYMAYLFSTSTEDIRGAGNSYRLNYSWKYVGNAANSTTSRTDYPNWIIYRMADIYLMEAEAYTLKDGNNETNYKTAIDKVNRIRQRANITSPLSASSSELDMLNTILNERAREFFSEGKRWYDLLRVARLHNYQNKEYLIFEIQQSASAMYAPIIRATLTNENSYYLPISSDELKLNKALVQNPYYGNTK
jgi:starch-binding outer membrane protein, SusD/RagB family